MRPNSTAELTGGGHRAQGTGVAEAAAASQHAQQAGGGEHTSDPVTTTSLPKLSKSPGERPGAWAGPPGRCVHFPHNFPPHLLATAMVHAECDPSQMTVWPRKPTAFAAAVYLEGRRERPSCVAASGTSSHKARRRRLEVTHQRPPNWELG